MSMFSVFKVAGTGMAAQSVRLSATASNLANANTTASNPQSVYRAHEPVFQAIKDGMFDEHKAAVGVRVAGVVKSAVPPRKRYDPHNPQANAQGYVWAPNVDPVSEMVNMLSASRSYQNNAQVLNTTKTLMLRTLAMGK